MWWNKLRRCRRGSAAAEFALITPIFLVLASGMVEFGTFFYRSSTVEKSLRAATMYAARSEYPLTSSTRSQIENIVRTGDPAGSGSLLIDDWSDASADLDITTGSYTVSGETLPIIRLEASVPYQSVVPGLLSGLGLGNLVIKAEHEQVHVGQ